jgi:predicted RecB family nuclease
MLYDLVMCEHRPWMDIHADPALRDRVSPFVQMLWKRGRAHEDEVAAGYDKPYLNLRTESHADRERLTLHAMERHEPLIYGGRLSSDDLLGEPDLLRLGPGGKYEPGDIKSGAAEEGPVNSERKPKVHYGVQLALYVDVLERLGWSDGRRAFIWDIHGDEIYYDLIAPKGPKTPSTLWDDYLERVSVAREIIADTRQSTPAYSYDCKQCWWNTACIARLESSDDLTLIPELGRTRRFPMLPHVTTIASLATALPAAFVDAKGKSILRGIGPETIIKYQARAALRTNGGGAYLKRLITLPDDDVELFFDIETDPMRDHCYLHGFVERRGRDDASEYYHGFFSSSATRGSERDAFAEAWSYVRSRRPCAIYIYSKYERTWWRALREKYPDVCSTTEMDELFADPSTVDLYEVIHAHTEWPTRDYSLKTLAKHLGFGWRDAHPSGAASIEWFDRYLSGDAEAKARILDYNEDDCRATRVLLDGVRRLEVLGTASSAEASAEGFSLSGELS